MTLADTFYFALQALLSYRLRSGLMLIAMAIGVAAVIILTALGEGARRYVSGEFASLGTHLLIALPGRAETSGGAPAAFSGQTPRDLTIDDAMAIARNRNVAQIAPLNIGSAPVSYAGREREAPILGTSAAMLDIRRWKMAQGQFLPSATLDEAIPVCVIGAKIKKELFGARSPIGEWLKVGERRYRVIGVLATEGRSIGVDTQEVVIMPIASAQMLLNTASLFRILIEARHFGSIGTLKKEILQTIKERHYGEEDLTIITQDSVIATFDRIFRALTLGVTGIAAISLAVAGILIMNVMLVAVSQRTAEIGLLKALGAPARQILRLFLAEAALLSFISACIGLVIGLLGSWALAHIYPALAGGPPFWAIAASISVAMICGLLFSLLPAKRAASLEPVLALQKR